MSTLIDLSHILNSTTQVYPGDPVFTSVQVAQVSKDGYSVHAISMGSHTGTHVDAPSHFFADGKTIDQLPLSLFTGPVLVINLTHKKPREAITWIDDLARYETQMHGESVVLLLYTGWSERWCTPEYHDHPYLEREAAERIIATGIRTVGFDTLNPDETPRPDGSTVGDGGFGVHEVILGAGGVICENLTNLHAIYEDGGEFVVSLVPLNLEGSDGSPVRAFARKVR